MYQPMRLTYSSILRVALVMRISMLSLALNQHSLLLTAIVQLQQALKTVLLVMFKRVLTM